MAIVEVKGTRGLFAQNADVFVAAAESFPFWAAKVFLKVKL
jgi:hypothetical protein